MSSSYNICLDILGRVLQKTTRKKPIPVVKDYMDIPVELTDKAKNVELCIDTLFINEIPFLATVARRLQYRTITPLDSQSMADYQSALDKVLRAYNARGFRITTIYCDNEYKPLLDVTGLSS